jgi:hypothetical protein
MKTRPAVLAALIVTAVVVSAEYAAVAGRVARAAEACSARAHPHAVADTVVTAAKLLAHALVCAAKS